MSPSRRILCCLLCVLPVAFWPGSTSYDAVKFLVLATAAAGWIVTGTVPLRKARPLPRNRKFLLTVGAGLLLVLLAGTFQATNRLHVLRTGLLIAIGLYAAHLAAGCRRDGDTARRLVACMVYPAALVAVYGLLQIARILPGAPIDSGLPPGISTLGNQNQVAGLAAILFLPSLALWRRPTGPIPAWLPAPAASAALLAMVLAGGATGPLVGLAAAGVLVGLELALHRSRWNRWSTRFFVAGAGLLVLAGCALTVAGLRGEDPDNPGRYGFLPGASVLESNHWHIRSTDWRVAWQMFRGAPWTGVGAGNYGAEWPATRAAISRDLPDRAWAEHVPVATRAHHEYLQWMAETGILGALWGIALALALGRSWLRILRTRESLSYRRLHVFAAGAVIVAGILGLVSFPLHTPAGGIVIAVLIGFCSWPAPAAPGTGTDPSTPRRRRLVPSLLLSLAALFTLSLGIREFVADLRIESGRRHFVRGEYRAAVADLERGGEWSFWPGQGLVFRGLGLYAIQETERAAEALAASLRESPTFEGMLALAEISIDRGDFRQAEELLSVVEACGPTQNFRIQAAYLRGLKILRQGETDAARGYFSRMLVAHPTSYRARLALGYLENLAGREAAALVQYRSAVATLDSLLSPSPDGTPIPARDRVRWERHRETARRALRSLSRR